MHERANAHRLALQAPIDHPHHAPRDSLTGVRLFGARATVAWSAKPSICEDAVASSPSGSQSFASDGIAERWRSAADNHGDASAGQLGWVANPAHLFEPSAGFTSQPPLPNPIPQFARISTGATPLAFRCALNAATSSPCSLFHKPSSVSSWSCSDW